jgi:1-acyl-sn-glycerol-3-phosphate acyltransferase
LRVTLRAARVIGSLSAAFVTYFMRVWVAGRAHPVKARAAWLQGEAQRLLRALGVEARYIGQPPVCGVLVSNHISYLDILVHAACSPQAFISKAEVAGWPVLGTLTRWAGTLFIQRERRSDVLRVAGEMTSVVDSGVVLTFFPEGTSSDGSRLLPFRASLLAPLVEHGWQITPASLRYGLEPGDGTVADEVAYYRAETVFGQHLLHLLGKRRIHATVHYGHAIAPGDDRKVLAHCLREEIRVLGEFPA